MSKKSARGRNIHGILLVDKPAEMTSNACLQTVKRLYFARKAGHTGSLDPLATGMLPICFGDATKFAGLLLDADKQYHVTARLGQTTTTADAEGTLLIEREVPEDIKTLLDPVLKKFRGENMQIPSMYSAIKHKGVPLYKLARQGIEVERQARKIHIFKLDVDQCLDQIHVSFKVHCSKGTYIRTLIEDIGEALGCGAHVVALRRTAVGGYTEAQMIPLTTLQNYRNTEAFTEMDTLILPIDCAQLDCPKLTVSTSAAFYLKQGTAIVIPHDLAVGEVAIEEKNGQFLGLAEVLADGRIAPKRLIVA